MKHLAPAFAALGLLLQGCYSSLVVGPEIVSLRISPSTVSLESGERVPLTATGLMESGDPADLSDRLEWTTSDPSILQTWEDEAEGTQVAALLPGSATLTATETQSGLTATLTVVVREFTDVAGARTHPDTKPCGPAKIEELLAPASEDRSIVHLNCRLVLDPRHPVEITKRIFFEGAGASGALLDCGGSTIHPAFPGQAIMVLADKSGDGTWARPENITVRRCQLANGIRVGGMPGSEIQASSFSEGHTERMQAAAPTNILFEKLTIDGGDGIPLYLSPGTTHVTLRNSELRGKGPAVAIYLDAETARNAIEDNIISYFSTKREQLAVDGSAHNRITGNRFINRAEGGIYLYRNCGERGTVRHQTPHHNRILDNFFEAPTFYPAIWVASRNGGRHYCGLDKEHPLGSGASDRDFARDNVIGGNQMGNSTQESGIRFDEVPNFLFP